MNNDLISREALKKALSNNTLIRDFNLQFDGIIGEIIDNAPTVIDHSVELVQKSIELGRRVGRAEEAIKSQKPQGGGMRLINANALNYKNLAEVNGRLTYVLTAEEIDNAPTVDTYTIEDIQEVRENALILGAKLAQRPQGEWIYLDKDEPMKVECPFCHERKCCISNYCDNCGAKMKGNAE